MTHTTDGHECSTCGVFGHECRPDAIAPASATDVVTCVECRVAQPRQSWLPTFVCSECPVCLEPCNMSVSGICRHGVCSGCLAMLSCS